MPFAIANLGRSVEATKFIEAIGDTMQGDLNFVEGANIRMSKGLITGVERISGGTPLILDDPTGIRFETPAGAERMRIVAATGNVGIGTTGPDATLEIRGPLFSAVPATGGEIIIGNSAMAPTWHLDNANGADRFRIFRQPDLTTPGLEFLTIRNDGNIGIRTTDPQQALDVSGNIRLSGLALGTGLGGARVSFADAISALAPTYTFMGDTDTGMFSPGIGSNILSFTTAGSERVRISAGGNVGIGTTAPGQTLTVGGSIGILEGGPSPSFHTVFQGGDQVANITHTLPTEQGAAGTVLTNNGAGVLSWVSPPAPPTAGLPRGYIVGLKLDFLTGDDLRIRPGVCRSQDGTVDLVLASALDINMPADLDTGFAAEAPNTWYAVWLVQELASGATIALFSANFTAPVLPAGLTHPRRIGSVRNAPDSQFFRFTQQGAGVDRDYLYTETASWFGTGIPANPEPSVHTVLLGFGSLDYTTVDVTSQIPLVSTRIRLQYFVTNGAQFELRVRPGFPSPQVSIGGREVAGQIEMDTAFPFTVAPLEIIPPPPRTVQVRWTRPNGLLTLDVVGWSESLFPF